MLDASALVEYLLRAGSRPVLAGRLQGEDLQAPHLIDVETLSVLRGLVLAGKLDVARAEEALDDLDTLVVQRHGHELLRRRAWQLRGNRSAYDAVYLALAELLEAPLVTTDARLVMTPGSSARVDVVVD